MHIGTTGSAHTTRRTTRRTSAACERNRRTLKILGCPGDPLRTVPDGPGEAADFQPDPDGQHTEHGDSAEGEREKEHGPEHVQSLVGHGQTEAAASVRGGLPGTPQGAPPAASLPVRRKRQPRRFPCAVGQLPRFHDPAVAAEPQAEPAQ